MSRQPLSTGDVKIEQMPPIGDLDEYEGDIVLVDPEFASKTRAEYHAALAFMEEPVTIVLNPSAEKYAATVFPVWVNGKPAEVLLRGKWHEIGYLPVSIPLIIKRKYLEIIIRAKVTSIDTRIVGPDSEQPQNNVERRTSPIHSFSILEDRNPKGAAWATEMMRRNY